MSEQPRRLILVRHGITDWNREGRFQGHLDPPLGDEGRREAELIATRLAGDLTLRPRRVISSSLARALQTAGAIAEAAGVEVEPDPRLMEIGQGRWEGRTHSELALNETRRYAAWRQAGGRRRPPGGELVTAAAQRLQDFLTELDATLARPETWPVCVVTHGGAMRVLARLVLDLTPARAWALDVDNASVSLVVSTSARTWRLERWNDTAHLLGREPTHVAESEGRPLAL